MSPLLLLLPDGTVIHELLLVALQTQPAPVTLSLALEDEYDALAGEQE